MLTGLRGVEGGNSSLPFVRVFHGSPSEHLWEDDFGETHSIPQGEGGEQGDAMMPLLCSVGQHEALQVAQQGMRDGEHFMAFLDYVRAQQCKTLCGRMQASGSTLGRRSGTQQAFDLPLQRLGQSGPGTEPRVWQGTGNPVEEQGIKILHPEVLELNY